MNWSRGDNAPSNPPTITMLQGKRQLEQQRRLLRYATGVLVAAVAILIRVALNPLFGMQLPYITFFAASMVAAWFAGTGPGLLTVAICGGASISQWLTLRHSYAAGDLTDLVGLALYLVLASGIAIVIGAERRTRRQMKALWERTS